MSSEDNREKQPDQSVLGIFDIFAGDNEPLRTLLRSAPVSIWMVDMQRVVRFVEGSIHRRLGWSYEDVIGHDVLEIFPELEYFEEAISNLEVGQEIKLTSKIKGLVLESRIAWSLSREGEIKGVVGVTIDTTQKNRVQSALTIEKQRMAVTLSSVSDAIVATDAQARIIQLNPVAQQLTQWPEADALGRKIGEVVRFADEKSRSTANNPAHSIVDGQLEGPVTNSETLLLSRDGRETLVSSQCSAIRSGEGEILGTLLVFRDISRQRVLEEELRRIEKLESVGLLAGGIAHDFNNLLTSVLGNVSLAKRRGSNDELIFDRLEEAEKAIRRAKELTNQLLTFSRGGAPITTTTAIQPLLEESTEFALSGSSCRSRFYFAEGLWPVEVDTGQITQVIQNLVLNAVQAMPGGGTIVIAAENLSGYHDDIPVAPGRYVKITVSDEGMGIPEEHLDYVFDPYYTTKERGTGLGLTTTYSILRRHGGHISVESEPNKGTTFYIYLPAGEKHITAQLKPLTVGRVFSGRALLMDDDKAIREVARCMLEDIGFEVEVADEGHEALEKYKRGLSEGRPFKICIMDLTIAGGLGGKATIALLRQIDPHVAAVVSSGYSNDPIMAAYEKHGFDAILPKPYGLEELVRVVRRALEGRPGGRRKLDSDAQPD